MTFTPALGRFAPARFYDRVVALTRERTWRTLTAMYVAPRPAEVIADVGCGTGSLTLLLARVEPRAQIIGLDPDPEVLAIARRKARAANAPVRWQRGMGDEVAGLVGEGSVNTVVSSLVLHQCPIAGKKAILASMFRSAARVLTTPGPCRRSPAPSRSTSPAGSDPAGQAARPRA